MDRGLKASAIGICLVTGCFSPPEFQAADVAQETLADGSTTDADGSTTADVVDGQCSQCPEGQGCKADGSCDNLGRFCAYTGSCPAGAGIGLDACLAQQCDGDPCLMAIAGLPLCSRACTIEKDDNGDGLEDADSPSTQCANAGAGPAGDATFHCVEVGPLTSTGAICLPGSAFKVCSRDSDCPPDEVCKITSLAEGGRCAARPQSGQWGTAVDVGGMCDDRADGLKRFCASGRCDATMCRTPCQSNTDCLAPGETATCGANGTCEGWLGSTCTSDDDCTRMWCDPATNFNGVVECAPRNCDYQDASCPDGTYCFTNALVGPEPSDLLSVCLPELEGGAASGATCDAAELCETVFWCLDWGPAGSRCSPPCLSNADCGQGQSCAVLSQDASTVVSDVPVAALCVPVDSASSPACQTRFDCPSGECFVYATPNIDPSTGLPHADGGVTSAGVCGALVGAPNKSACTNNAECASGICGQGNCLPACTSQADCAGLSYAAYCAGQRYFPEGIAADLNVFVSGCFAAPTGATLTDCSSDYTCANGEACIPALIDRGPEFAASADFLCMPTTGALDVGEGCTSTNDCDSTLCIQDPSGPYCSGLCQSDGDCMNGTTCNFIDLSNKQGAFSSNGAPVSICLK